jgi:hypothetical protein
MLDVHPAHHAATTWRDFFIHIATIVIGLLIAIGLEQTVEYFHHRHQAHQVEAALHQESLENDEVVKNNVAALDEWIENNKLNMTNLEAALAKDGRTAFVYIPARPGVGWLPLSNAAWLSARDGVTLPLLPHNLVDNYWRIDFIGQEAIVQGHEYFRDNSELNSLLHLHADTSVLTAHEKELLALAFNRKDARLRALRSTMLYFQGANMLALRNHKIDVQSLLRMREEQSLAPAQ